MTLRDDLPVSRCAVRGCVFVGPWPEGERCPQHRGSEWDPPRKPSTSEFLDAPDTGRG